MRDSSGIGKSQIHLVVDTRGDRTNMTSIFPRLLPRHLLASHLFNILLIWHSPPRWWMCVLTDAWRESLWCSIVMQKTSHGLSHIQTEGGDKTHWKPLTGRREGMFFYFDEWGICAKQSTVKTHWYNVLQCISLHWGNNKMPSRRIVQPSDQKWAFPFDRLAPSLSARSPLSCHGQVSGAPEI